MEKETEHKLLKMAEMFISKNLHNILPTHRNGLAKTNKISSKFGIFKWLYRCVILSSLACFIQITFSFGCL